MHTVEMFSTILMPFMFLYIFLFSIALGQKYLRIYTRSKMLRFTQEEVKGKRGEIAVIMEEIQKSKNSSIPWADVDNKMNNIIKVFSLYNELAVGINEGLYDELYVKMIMGYDMMDFYKNNYKVIISTSDAGIDSSRFMPLELLLKRWDSGNGPSYLLKNHRGYL